MKVRIAGFIALFICLSLTAAHAAVRELWQLGYRPIAKAVPGMPVFDRPADKPIRYRINFTAYLMVKRNPRHERVRIWLPLPADDAYQAVFVYRLKPAPERFLEGRYGHRVAYYDFGVQPKGAVVTVEYDAEVSIGKVDWRIDPDQVGALQEIPAQIQADYLVDGPMYQVNHPDIAFAAQEAVAGETHPLRMMARIVRYVRNRLIYNRDAHKMAAPTVLQTGEGSCTEFSFLLIGMARHLGLPARYMAGSTDKHGRLNNHFDDRVFHKIVEVYLPRVGWVPVESTGGLKHRDRRTPEEIVGWIGRRMIFFVHEPEPGLAPLDPRRNVLTYVPFRQGSKLRISRNANLRWTVLE